MEIIDSAVASCILNPTVSQKPTFLLGANVLAAFDAGGAWAGWEDREGIEIRKGSTPARHRKKIINVPCLQDPFR